MRPTAFPQIMRYSIFVFSFFVVFFQLLLVLSTPGYAQHEIINQDKGSGQFPVFLLTLNDETKTLPVLPNFELQLDLKKKDIDVAYTRVNKAIECLLWSDELFSWVKFGNMNDMPLKTPFPRADRLYCWNANQLNAGAAVMVEDVHGNQELIQLESQNVHLMTAKWKRPLDIQRAVSFARRQDDCRFRSRKDISRSFPNDMQAGSLWAEPFLGAIEVFCFRF